MNSFYEYFEKLLVDLSASRNDSFILTDSNINLLSLNNNVNSSRLIELTLSHGFINLISKATPITQNNFSLIDQIFTNCDKSAFSSGVFISDISDHFFTFTSFSHKRKNLSIRLKLFDLSPN